MALRFQLILYQLKGRSKVAREQYLAQLGLLVSILPVVAGFDVFARKGGTAINLFIRQLPRLSIDIDLVYLPVQPRGQSLESIRSEFEKMRLEIGRLSGIRAYWHESVNDAPKLFIEAASTRIKIETSDVMRGTVHAVAARTLAPVLKANLQG